RERTKAGQYRTQRRAGARLDDMEILDLGAFRVDADSQLRRVAVRHHFAELRLAGGIERNRIEQQDLVPFDSSEQLRLRLAFLRALKKFAAVLEKRRVGLVAIEIAG